MAQQPDRCSNTKSLRLFRNSNRPLGTPVSTEGGGASRKGMFWDVFWRWQPRWLNAQIVEGCSKEKGHTSWRPLSWSLGQTEWYLCLISVSAMEEKWQSRRGGKQVVPHEEPCRSESRSWNGLYILLVANEGSAAVEHYLPKRDIHPGACCTLTLLYCDLLVSTACITDFCLSACQDFDQTQVLATMREWSHFTNTSLFYDPTSR